MPKRDAVAEAIARTSIEKDIASIQKDVKDFICGASSLQKDVFHFGMHPRAVFCCFGC